MLTSAPVLFFVGGGLVAVWGLASNGSPRAAVLANVAGLLLAVGLAVEFVLRK